MLVIKCSLFLKGVRYGFVSETVFNDIINRKNNILKEIVTLLFTSIFGFIAPYNK